MADVLPAWQRSSRRPPAAQLGAEHPVFAMKRTGRQVWLLTVVHLHEHPGQAIARARSNDIVPPWSRQQGG